MTPQLKNGLLVFIIVIIVVYVMIDTYVGRILLLAAGLIGIIIFVLLSYKKIWRKEDERQSQSRIDQD